MLNLTSFASLSFIYLSGSIFGIRIRIHKAPEYGSGSITLISGIFNNLLLQANAVPVFARLLQHPKMNIVKVWLCKTSPTHVSLHTVFLIARVKLISSFR